MDNEEQRRNGEQRRKRPISGRYRGEMTAPDSGRNELVLRVDTDQRNANSPVINRISGDIFQKYRYDWPGKSHIWREYRESWIVDDPNVDWKKKRVKIDGQVRHWESSHPATRVRIRIPRRRARSPGPAEVEMWETGSEAVDRYTCRRKSSGFRKLTLEVDVCESVDAEPRLPRYDTHALSTRPSEVSQRELTVESAFREAGVETTIDPEHTVVDDSASEFDTWSDAELHDAMETHFSQYKGQWPKWHMWGFLAGSYDVSSVGGIMFDAGLDFGGPGRTPERQGFTVFRDHQWFDELPAGAPTNEAEAWALRQYLYTWVHEAGHAFNFLHSWDKGRPGAHSWMQYPQFVENFWEDFEFRFDDPELLQLRHGDRNSVIMGGDAWATGGHFEARSEVPVDKLSSMEGDPPGELLIRSNGYFEPLEPVRIELRVRNLMSEQPLELDPRLHPEFGKVMIFIRKPDDTVVRFEPVVHKLASEETITLDAPARATEGEDRYSDSIFIGYGANGAYFEQPGEYMIRAAYQDTENLRIVSNTHTITVGAPRSREEERLAHRYFSDDVGLALSFNGSRSPYLAEGMEVLEEIADQFEDSLAGAKAATTVATSLNEPFFSVRDGTVTKIQDAKPEEALQHTESVKNLYQERTDDSLNILYHSLVRMRAEVLEQVGRVDQAREEIETLRDDLADRGVNQPVLDDIEEFGDAL